MVVILHQHMGVRGTQHFLSVSDPWKNKLGQVEDENGKG
jgi:hypothetical protein